MAYTVTTIKANNARDVVTSLDQTKIFVSDASANQIQVFDTRSGALLQTFVTAQPLGALSLSENGQFIYAASLNSPVIYQLSTANGAQIGEAIVGSGGVYADIEVVDADTLVVSGSGNTAIIDLVTRTSSPLTLQGAYTGSSIMTEDQHLTLLGETGISNGPLYLFDDRTNTIVARGDSYQSSNSGFNYGMQAVSEAAGLVMQGIYSSSINIYDLNLRYLRTVSFNSDPFNPTFVAGLSFSASGDKAYVLMGNHNGTIGGGAGKLVEYDARTFAPIQTYDLGNISPTNSGNVHYGNNILITNAGQSFIVTNPDTGSLQLVAITAAAPIFGTEGNDTLNGTANADIIDGRGGDDTLDGGLGRDVLIGGAGNDRLIGGTGDGNEMYGGTGDDVYVVSADDSVIENAGEGLDKVETTRSGFVLPANVEQLVYTGTGDFTGTGNALDNFIQGGAGNDSLSGGLGADTLVGGAGNDLLDGGTGAANEMIGGLGNDVYYVSVLGDSVVEQVGQGTDMVRTSLDRYVLNANVESLVYTGNGAFNGVGSAEANLIVGGASDDILDGGAGNDVLVGGSGNDVLIGGAGNNELQGGAGNDIYYVSSSGDSVVEAIEGGTDLVITDASYYALGNNVENLTSNGQGDFRGEGNALDNVIVGGFGNDVLLGYDGNDTIRGGAGNDLIEGAAGDDSIGGGDGNDTLTGGAGADRFVFDTALGTLAANVDHVTDFATGVDGFQLDHNAFAALNVGALAEGQFHAGAVAMDADDRILYDEATGTLYYDADGNGAGLAIAFATVTPTTLVAYTDFVVI